jgi:hypothetical protein
MTSFRPATIKDAVEFYGKYPANRFKGFVAVKDEKVIGIGGIFYLKSDLVAFTDIKPEMRQDKKAIVKGCRMIMDMIKELNRPVYAIANASEPTAAHLLERLGFIPTGLKNDVGETLVWGGE